MHAHVCPAGSVGGACWCTRVAQGLSNFAFAHGLIMSVAGSVLLLLLAAKAGSVSLGPCGRAGKHMIAMLDGEVRVCRLNLTGLRLLALGLLTLSLSAAIALTYFFPPYLDINNGFLSCWLLVVASALLLPTVEAPPAETPQVDVEVVSTLSGDAAAEMVSESISMDAPEGVGAGGASLAEAPAAVQTEPPFAEGLGVCCILVRRRLASPRLPSHRERSAQPPFAPPLSCAPVHMHGQLLVAAAHRYSESSLAGYEGLSIWALICSNLTIVALGPPHHNSAHRDLLCRNAEFALANAAFVALAPVMPIAHLIDSV